MRTQRLRTIHIFHWQHSACVSTLCMSLIYFVPFFPRADARCIVRSSLAFSRSLLSCAHAERFETYGSTRVGRWSFSSIKLIGSYEMTMMMSRPAERETMKHEKKWTNIYNIRVNIVLHSMTHNKLAYAPCKCSCDF